MKEKIKQHVDDLFAGVFETKQLQELKEEICSNLLEKINECIVRGISPETAFQNAVVELGDMSELVDHLKEASNARFTKDTTVQSYMDRAHVLGYLTASVILLIGLLTAGYVYLQQREWFVSLGYFAPFILAAAPIYIYYGLTQESEYDYGMSKKRALTYSLASEVFLFGVVASAIEHVQGHSLPIILLTFGPFVLISASIFLYLGLTEKSRRKMGVEWQNQWVSYYNDPQAAMVRGSISGALWIFSFAAFFFIGFAWSWKYSWIVFVIAVGCEPLIEAYFSSKRKQ